MNDSAIVTEMLQISDAFSILCDPDTFDEALDMMGCSNNNNSNDDSEDVGNIKITKKILLIFVPVTMQS